MLPLLILQASVGHSQTMDYGNKVLTGEWNPFRHPIRRITQDEILERI